MTGEIDGDDTGVRKGVGKIGSDVDDMRPADQDVRPAEVADRGVHGEDRGPSEQHCAAVGWSGQSVVGVVVDSTHH
ncbi:hypothetical protein ABZ614_13830 [Streptomyces sp. NPDC013178]|uniref:hypothetical protein n=1 Tax=Streptomyces sp. NPDC013178 TaxID=3155118 RepID=UPI0033F6DA82